MKRLRKIGLIDSYNNQQETHKIFRASLALPLLPMADICPAFDDVKSLLMDDLPRKDLLQKLLRYDENHPYILRWQLAYTTACTTAQSVNSELLHCLLL